MTSPSTETVTFLIRPMRETDTAFLFSSFLKSFRESDFTDGIGNDSFYSTAKVEWARVLERFSVAVAHPEGNEDEIAGWLAWRGYAIGYVYVKHEPWRRMGVCRQLLTHAGFLTPEGSPRPSLLAIALYGSSRMLHLARSKGMRVELAAHVEALRLLSGKPDEGVR